MKEGWKIYQFGELVTFDKRFKGIERAKQKNIVTFNHVSAELLKSLPVDGGDVKLLATGLFDGYTTTENAAENLNNGEVITIPSGGNANIKYYKGLFVDSGNILAVSNREDIYLKYVWYYLLFQNEFLESCFKGTSIKHPYMPDIWELDVPVPPISEQERIVSYLDAQFAKIDALIANTEQQLQAAKDLFQSALKEMFTPKEGWEETTIGGISEIKGGKRVPKGYKLEVENTGHIYIRVTDFNDKGTIDLNNLMYINDRVYEQIKRYIITDKDVYISIAGTIGKAGIIPSCLNGANLTENACRLVLNEKAYNRYVYYYTLLPSFKKQLTTLTKTGSQPKLALTRLATAYIAFPSLPEQERIAARLDAISEKVKALQENYTKTLVLCNDLKQSLLKSIFE